MQQAVRSGFLHLSPPSGPSVWRPQGRFTVAWGIEEKARLRRHAGSKLLGCISLANHSPIIKVGSVPLRIHRYIDRYEWLYDEYVMWRLPLRPRIIPRSLSHLGFPSAPLCVLQVNAEGRGVSLSRLYAGL